MIGRQSITVRLSLGLVSLTISLLLAAELVGLLPDKTEAKFAARTKIVELLAVQVSLEAANNNIRMVQGILTALVERDDDILSAALRRESGGVLATAGNHEKHWEPAEDGRSTQTHVQVPILKGENRWGVVELSFKSLNSPTSLAAVKDSPFALLAFISLTGFIFYFMFLRRTLRELDPSSVIPEHVKAALDTLVEGVIIMDEKEQIVLANSAFGVMVGQNAGDLTGHRASTLDWLHSQTDEDSSLFPWQLAMKLGTAQTGITLCRQADDEVRIYVVNAALILDAKGKTRGTLATFDDISEMEKKNEELLKTLKRLANSKEEVTRQNKELRFLATRDPLTGLLNRRALFSRLEKMFDESWREGKALSAIMIDIDHFKSINDRYGHSAGDKVIEFVGTCLMAVSAAGDIPSRYGGEEFCLILPGKDLKAAAVLAEQLRQDISEGFEEKFSSRIPLTISLGVATLEESVDSAATLVNQADKALYAAKAGGRNCVVNWGAPRRRAPTSKMRTGSV